jgi:hypothetical protein
VLRARWGHGRWGRSVARSGGDGTSSGDRRACPRATTCLVCQALPGAQQRRRSDRHRWWLHRRAGDKAVTPRTIVPLLSSGHSRHRFSSVSQAQSWENVAFEQVRTFLQSRTHFPAAPVPASTVRGGHEAHADRSRPPASAVSLWHRLEPVEPRRPRCDDYGFGGWLSSVWQGCC